MGREEWEEGCLAAHNQFRISCKTTISSRIQLDLAPFASEFYCQFQYSRRRLGQQHFTFQEILLQGTLRRSTRYPEVTFGCEREAVWREISPSAKENLSTLLSG